MGQPQFHVLDAMPSMVAPLNQAVEADGWVFLAGQVPNRPDDVTEPLPEGIEAQTRRVMENLRLVLAEIGLGFENVVAARAFLTHFHDDYEAMNRVYAEYFPEGRRPARTCIGVTGLALDARVEIDVIARRP